MFLHDPTSPEATAFLEHEQASNGYVMNLERAWAWRPDAANAFVALRKQVTERSTLSAREVALLVCATARAVGDSYCALAWGTRLAGLAGPAAAAQVLANGTYDALDPREAALVQWAARIVENPNATTAAQVQALRDAGLAEREIFEATLFIALRLAFSTVNDALGAQPDRELVAAAPPAVRAAVSYGRAPESTVAS